MDDRSKASLSSGHVAGWLTWAVVALPIVIDLSKDPASLAAPRILAWLVAFAVYGAAYSAVAACPASDPRRGRRLGFIAVETAAALAMTALATTPFAGAPLVVVAAQLASTLPPRAALGWIGGQSLLASVLFLRAWGLESALGATGAYLAFQLFATYVTRVADREAAARRDLALANAELTATRDLLAESARVGERLRISRELHDVVGHHLTALALNLEAASHLVRQGVEKGAGQGPALEHVERARALARLLLADVREVVSTLATDPGLDLARAVRVLAAAVPRPSVVLNLPERLTVDDPAVAHALLRAVQEILTNAMRHSGAEHLWLDLSVGEGGAIALSARDDGRGAEPLHEGRGLAGLRQRVSELGGGVEIRSTGGRGFSVSLSLPARRDAA